MFYISDDFIDRLLLDDVQLGDLTTRALGIGSINGKMRFIRRQAGRVSGVFVASRILLKLGLTVDILVFDGQNAQSGEVLLTAEGRADALHQGWKVAQNVLEWSCGVAQYMAEMMQRAQSVNPSVRIACTRKSIPATKALAIPAVLDGGGIIHRGGTAETVLLFANHRRFFSNPNDWAGMISRLRAQAPEKKIIVEADSEEEAMAALAGQPDIIQLDKFTLPQIRRLQDLVVATSSRCRLSVAGGVHQENVADYAATGVDLIVTSSPYYATPADVKVVLEPQR
ncbi:ModD protein [Leminorella grimontii]|uniref:ModD protein n=1 Tax=Leminorella grimontii TaxID=82981 RepID=UPI00321FCCB2